MMVDAKESEPLNQDPTTSHFKASPMRVSIEPAKQFKWAFESKSHCLHRFLWGIIMIGSTSLAIYSSTSIYLSWQAAPVLTTFGSDILPIHDLDFPSIILCSPGNNMESLSNLSRLLHKDWTDFWSTENETVLENFATMTTRQQGLVRQNFLL